MGARGYFNLFITKFLLIAVISYGQSAQAAKVGAVAHLTLPLARQVVQRAPNNMGPVAFSGTFTGAADGFEARSILLPGYSGREQGWADLVGVRISKNRFSGIYDQATGGFYNFQIRPTYRGAGGKPMTASQVGIGEVFLTGGQSNATNSGVPTGFAPDRRVSSFDGKSWRYGIDPQPAPDKSRGGSPWPAMASNLAIALDMPVGINSLGYGGSSISQWQPDSPAPLEWTRPNGQPNLFANLVQALNYFSFIGGVRAILWDQGESDYALQTPTAEYQRLLQNLITQSRIQSAMPVKWMVAQVGGGPTTPDLVYMAALRQAQANVADGVLTFVGPNTDLLGLAYRNVLPSGFDLHFNAEGLMTLGSWWGMYVHDFYAGRFLN